MLALFQVSANVGNVVAVLFKVINVKAVVYTLPQNITQGMLKPVAGRFNFSIWVHVVRVIFFAVGCALKIVIHDSAA